MGQYVQLIRTDHKFDFLKIPQDNFSGVDSIVHERKVNKFIFPNYIFEKFINDAGKLGIKITEIDFYDDISDELQEKINESIGLNNYIQLINLIKNYDLDIKYLEFYDNNKKTNRIFSNGIIWKEKSSKLLEILSKII